MPQYFKYIKLDIEAPSKEVADRAAEEITSYVSTAKTEYMFEDLDMRFILAPNQDVNAQDLVKITLEED